MYEQTIIFALHHIFALFYEGLLWSETLLVNLEVNHLVESYPMAMYKVVLKSMCVNVGEGDCYFLLVC